MDRSPETEAECLTGVTPGGVSKCLVAVVCPGPGVRCEGYVDRLVFKLVPVLFVFVFGGCEDDEDDRCIVCG